MVELTPVLVGVGTLLTLVGLVGIERVVRRLLAAATRIEDLFVNGEHRND